MNCPYSRVIINGRWQCDKIRMAPESRSIRPVEAVTFFDVDFESILCRADTGERLREPVEDYVHKLSEDVKFHARMTREHRADSLGKQL
jgi:hypothetical protein